MCFVSYPGRCFHYMSTRCEKETIFVNQEKKCFQENCIYFEFFYNNMITINDNVNLKLFGRKNE